MFDDRYITYVEVTFLYVFLLVSMPMILAVVIFYSMIASGCGLTVRASCFSLN